MMVEWMHTEHEKLLLSMYEWEEEEKKANNRHKVRIIRDVISRVHNRQIYWILH